MASNKSWFEVDRDGLAALQEGKPKWHIARELVQNAWDEAGQGASLCKVEVNRGARTLTLSVEDDSPEGFKDLRDAFTLFGHTRKRSDPTQRGRFNLGEKQAIARCKSASIMTTKGALYFGPEGRRHGRGKLAQGSIVSVTFAGTDTDKHEIETWLRRFLPPSDVEFVVNGEHVPYKTPHKSFAVTLTSESLDEHGTFRRTARYTRVDLHRPENGKAFLFEMGIPVCEIDCKYSVDVQQKVPLSSDRETVPESYLRDLYAEVLNHTAEELRPEEASQTWVRMGTEDERATPAAVRQVIKQRFGDKVVAYSPNDPRANEDAVSAGYKVVHGSEMSADEWEQVREAQAIPSSTNVFGLDAAPSTPVTPDKDMEKFADLADTLYRRTMGKELRVRFAKLPGSAYRATWARGDPPTVTFFVNRFPDWWFAEATSEDALALLIHEAGHQGGAHFEHAFHEEMGTFAARLIRLALTDPRAFNW